MRFVQIMEYVWLPMIRPNVIARMVRRFPTKPMTALIMIQTPSAIVVIVKPLSSLGKQSFEKSTSGILVKQ